MWICIHLCFEGVVTLQGGSQLTQIRLVDARENAALLEQVRHHCLDAFDKFEIIYHYWLICRLVDKGSPKQSRLFKERILL